MRKRTQCRACGSRALTPVFSIASGAAPFAKSGAGTGSPAFVLCDPSRDARACGLLQAAAKETEQTPVPSSRRASTREHLRAAATESLEIISGRDCAALDIGCNDGALLAYFPRWVERYGVDPHAHTEEVGAWAETVKATFPSAEFNAAVGEKKFDIITAISLIEHCDNPRALLEGVKARLADDGVFTLETLYAPMTLTSNNIEAVYSGVAAIYSLSVLEWLVREAGLKIVKGALTSKDGGSIRLFITHSANNEFDFDPWSERLARLWDEENALAMRAIQPYQLFAQRIDAVREEFADMLDDIAARGECAQILGSDPQMLGLMDWAGPAAKVVNAVVDTAAARDHARIPGGRLRIISESDSRAEEPDYLIAPASYKREILERWRETILLGARIIFITPTPHIVTSTNFACEYGKTIASGDSAAGVETLRTILAAAGGPRLVADNAATGSGARAVIKSK